VPLIIIATAMAFVFIVRLSRMVRRSRRGQRLSAGTGAIRSASTEEEPVHIMAVWRNGCETQLRDQQQQIAYIWETERDFFQPYV
jgi:hypothetical protein